MIDRFRAFISTVIARACRVMLVMACGVAAYGLAVISLRFPVVGWGLLGLAAWRRFHRRSVTDSYGSAAIASASQMERGGLLSDDGLILGRCLADPPSLSEAVLGLFSPSTSSALACRAFFAAAFSRRWLGDRLIRVSNYVHLLTCSPAGGGKSVAALIPNLLAYRGNCVVVDPKGELFQAVATHRRRKFGHKIIRLDPFGVCGTGGDTLNPFDFIDHRADDFVDQVRDLADMLVIRPHDEKDPYWNESACANVAALSSFVCGAEPDPGRRNLGTVRAIAASRGKYAQAVEIMQQTDACQGVIATLGGSLTWHEGKELASVQTTLASHTNFLDSPVVRRNTATSSFDPMILRTGKADIFLILPHDRLQSLSRLQRLWIGTIMRRTTRGTPTEHNPVLWLLDEMAHIGHMKAIEDATTLMRGMGVRLWFIFQSLGQLKTCFGEKAATVLDNIGTQQYFGINSYETADEISKRIGDATIGITTVNDTSGHSYSTGNHAQPQSGNRSTSESITRSEIARRLVKPEEVLTLKDNVCLIFHKNLPVCLGRLVKFYEAPEFKRGGIAAPRRLGLAAAIMAVAILFASTSLTSLALTLTQPQPAPQWPGRAADMEGDGGQAGEVSDLPPPPPGSPAGLPAWRPVPQHRTRTQGRSGESGFLIKIE